MLDGQYEEALKLFDDCLAMRRTSLGHMHPEVARALHQLGEVYYEQGKFQESKQTHERSLKMRRTVLNAGESTFYFSISLFLYFSILVVSCFMWSGALDC